MRLTKQKINTCELNNRLYEVIMLEKKKRGKVKKSYFNHVSPSSKMTLLSLKS